MHCQKTPQSDHAVSSLPCDGTDVGHVTLPCVMLQDTDRLSLQSLVSYSDMQVNAWNSVFRSEHRSEHSFYRQCLTIDNV